MQFYELTWGWKHWSRKQFILCVVIFVAGSIILDGISDLADKAELGPDPHPKMSGLLQSKAVWSALKITHYKMTVERTNWGNHSFCSQKVEVQDEKVVNAVPDTCGQPPTVSELYAHLEQDMKSVQWANGVGCDIIAIHITYYHAYSYPDEIIYRQEHPNSLNAPASAVQQFATQYYSKEICDPKQIPEASIRIKSLTPLADRGVS